MPAAILELARREATIVEVGKTAYGPSWKQDDINALLVEARAARARRWCGSRAAIRRSSGGSTRRSRRWRRRASPIGVVPGITSASAAAAAIGQSLTRRGRNSAFRILTGHDVDGFAEHDWRELARPGATAAIYMGVKAATFVRGRLLMHGARRRHAGDGGRERQPARAAGDRDDADRPAEGAGRGGAATGPVMILYGLAPRAAALALDELKEAL